VEAAPRDDILDGVEEMDIGRTRCGWALAVVAMMGVMVVAVAVAVAVTVSNASEVEDQMNLLGVRVVNSRKTSHAWKLLQDCTRLPSEPKSELQPPISLSSSSQQIQE
jgi:hypothetical protein